MAYAYLTPDNIFKTWEDSKRYTDELTNPFPELQRIARNRPFDDQLDDNYPNVTDGTTASIVRKTPKRVVQQLPTGTVDGEDIEDYLPIVAEDIFVNKIIPSANEDYSLFEKSHLIIESGLTFGFGCSYTPFVNHDGYFCPDLTLPYWGDIYIQRGKKSARSSAYVFIRSWWQTADIDNLIQSEQDLAKQAKARGETYESTWDTGALKEIRKAITSKDEQGKTPSEDEHGNETEGIEIVTGFQKGVASKFYTFNPEMKKVIRTKVNKDPRGAMPLDWFFGDTDGTSPLGRGIVELIGGLQNLIDSDMQAYQYNRALALQPPVVKYGNIGTFRFEPNFVVDAQNDPTAKIVPLTVDTAALTNYPQLYGLQKSQLLNLVSSPDTSISSDVGNPGFSKTPTGINQQQANISVDDNAIRKRFEAWFEAWAETAINLYFAERTGTEVYALSQRSIERLTKLAEEDKFDLSLLKGNKLLINYDDATPALKFRVDASTSRMADDKTQLEANKLLLDSLDSSQVLQGVIPPEKVIGLWNSMVKLSGREDPEEVAIDIKEFKQQQAQAQAAAQTVQPQLPAGQMPQPQQPQMSPEDQQIAAHLQALGVPDNLIAQALQMLDQGASEHEVLAFLTQQGAPSG